MKSSIVALAFLSVLFQSHALETQTHAIDLVRDGRPVATIVAVRPREPRPTLVDGKPVPGKPVAESDETLAIRTLVEWVKKITAAELVVSDQATDGVPAIYVGKAALAAGLDLDDVSGPNDAGFRITVDENRVLIGGKNDAATLKAVCRFLEELGCRYLMDVPLDEEFPRSTTLSVKTMNITERPGLTWHSSQGPTGKSRLWLAWNGPQGVPPPLVSTDPAYDQYVTRLYVTSTVLRNGRIGYVAYGNKDVPPGTDGVHTPNYLTFYYSDDRGKTLHIGFFLVPPPDPNQPAGLIDPRIGQTPDGDAVVFFPAVPGRRPNGGFYSLYACVVRNSQTGTRGTFSVGPLSYLCRGTAGMPTIVGSELLLPTYVAIKQEEGITHHYQGVRLWSLAINKGDVIVPKLISQLPDLPVLKDNSFCDPFLVPIGDRGYRMLIRGAYGPYWCDSDDRGLPGTWGTPYKPTSLPTGKSFINGMTIDHEGDMVVAYNASTSNRYQAALAVYRPDGTIARLTFDPREPPVGTHMSNFVVSIDRDRQGKPTGNYIVTYDHGRGSVVAGLERDGINYRGAICTAVIPKSCVLRGTSDGVVIHEVRTHP